MNYNHNIKPAPNPNPRPKVRRAVGPKISKKELRRLLISLLIFFSAIFLFRLFGLALLIPLIPIALGLSFPKWYLGRKKPSAKLVEIIAWSNVVLWALPPLGLLTNCATIKFAKYFELKKRQYLLLGYGGLVATIINIVWGLFSW